jgi:AraC-like DNA-binding protein
MRYISVPVLCSGACKKKGQASSACYEARHYLNNSVLGLNEAADLLGYEDGDSFVRAFRTWEGIPPARRRERTQAAS